MNKNRLGLFLLMGLLFLNTSIAWTQNIENFFEDSGGAIVAGYAHPREAYQSTTVLDNTSRYIEIQIDFNWTRSVYRIVKSQKYYFTGITCISEGSLVPSFKNCPEPSLSYINNDYMNQYLSVIGKSRRDLTKIEKICLILSYRYALYSFDN